jgi:hypothetical protein
MTRYSIEKLLIEGVQPFQPLTPVELDDLKRDIASKGKRLDKMPVHLSADDILYDGHQRLRILLELGRKQIGEEELIRNTKIKGRRNAYFEAVKINRQRRHLTGEAMSVVIWNMVTEYGMSQTAIGKQIGMKQQSVSELMKKYPPAEGLPKTVSTVGADGKTYTRTPSRVYEATDDPTPPPPPRPRPWEPDGNATLTLIRARKALADNTPTDSSLNSFQRNHLRNLLRDLAKDCANFIDDYLT